MNKLNNKKHIVNKCTICGNIKLYYMFSVDRYRLVQCNECSLLMLNPQPSDEDLDAIYKKDYFSRGEIVDNPQVDQLKNKTAGYYLDIIHQYRGFEEGELLEIGYSKSNFIVEAAARGYNVTRLDVSSSVFESTGIKIRNSGSDINSDTDSITGKKNQFDICVLSDVLENMRDPRDFLAKVHDLLKPDGVIFIATPVTDSRSARLFKDRWMEFKPEHLCYFSTSNLQSLMFHCSYREIICIPDNEYMSLDNANFDKFPDQKISWIKTILRKLTFSSLRQKPVPSGVIAIGRAKPVRERKTLSIVMPAYNEAATIETTLNGVLEKEIDNLDTEVIIVESNSNDGTRDIVMKYKDHPRVKLVLEESPKGKGHAVRTGFKHITGDFVLIQDADMEYDLDDYDLLLEPLITGRKAFVLGSRHGGRTWKIRHMEGNPFATSLFNVGHLIFMTLVNTLYWIRLNDPFTMFKVFRADCLYGLDFECNRFDFDYELLIKLMRKGYRPVEIPVNYNARTFEEGKKVSVLRDPWTWLRAIIKYRIIKIDPISNINNSKNT